MELSEKKKLLIETLIHEGHLKSKAVIRAFEKVQREDFIPPGMQRYAYVDEPLPIGSGQTISQPLTIADMTEALDANPGHKILEVGAGSGYQAALLSEIVGPAGRVITAERIPDLARSARENLKNAGCKNVSVVEADGSQGYEKEAPYDRIIVTASAPDVPKPLVEQLKPGGRMVIPVGNEMLLIEKRCENIKKTLLGYYVFVPLIGEHGYKW